MAQSWSIQQEGDQYFLRLPLRRAEKEDVFEQMQNYVDTHLSDRITLRHVAQHCGISTSSVSQIFQKRIGLSFHRYLTQRRLSAAEALLLSGVPLEQIYKTVGYQDYSSFFRAFRSRNHCSPTQFLQIHSRKQDPG